MTNTELKLLGYLMWYLFIDATCLYCADNCSRNTALCMACCMAVVTKHSVTFCCILCLGNGASNQAWVSWAWTVRLAALLWNGGCTIFHNLMQFLLHWRHESAFGSMRLDCSRTMYITDFFIALKKMYALTGTQWNLIRGFLARGSYRVAMRDITALLGTPSLDVLARDVRIPAFESE